MGAEPGPEDRENPMKQQKSFFSFKFEPPEPKKRRRPKRLRAGPRPLLTIGQILAWADAHHARTGSWPSFSSGPIDSAVDEDWKWIDRALSNGHRGLLGGSSLSRLLAEQRGRREHMNPPVLTVEQILAWADTHFERTGCWPVQTSGAIAGVPGETWSAVHQALSVGRRGLPGGSSLARLFAAHRGRPNPKDVSRLTTEQVLNWADAYFGRVGRWPTATSGPIDEAPGENWANIGAALHLGLRGLPGGSSLARLFAERRGRRNHMNLPALSVTRILQWADKHFRRTGRWPVRTSGPIEDAPGETWGRIDTALKAGGRGLAGSGSLTRLLATHRGRQSQRDLPVVPVKRILDWADAHFRRTGSWPSINSGPIVDAPGETWSRINNALARGLRGLRGGSSLAVLLQERRGRRNHMALPALTVKQILAWADVHQRRTGDWPTSQSGPIAGAAGESWQAINDSLGAGTRGLDGGTTLVQLLAEHRGRRAWRYAPALTVKQILAWADAHFRRTGRWPTMFSGAVPDRDDETWAAINGAFRDGRRGLPGGTTLARFLARHGRKPLTGCPPRATP
jgi:hypothetical protein